MSDDITTRPGELAGPTHGAVDQREQAAILALVKRTSDEWFRTAVMIEEAGSALRLLGGEWSGLEDFDVDRAKALASAVEESDIDEYQTLIEQLAEEGVRLLTVLDEAYPLNLRHIYNRPPFLFVKGQLLEEDNRSIAVVGTRAASAEGIEQATLLSSQLASSGVTVLSGLAKGIDSAAHRAALEGGGRTVAVMGTGIRKIYPAENKGLAEEILEHGGALVSQFWPDGPPTKYSFPMRNVVMSGMGIGTVVIEAGPTSGARMQARLSLEHGKRLFLVDSLVLKEEWAQNYAAKRGARVVKSVKEILDELVSLAKPPRQLTLA